MGVLKIFYKNNRFYNPKSKIKAYPFLYISSRRYSDLKINERDDILPVLIVGAGPVGLVLSILLTKLGVKCAVMEKSSSFSQNNLSMEEIERLQPPVALWRKFIYCTSLYGSILGSVDHMQPQDFKRVVSPVSVAHFSQYKLTKLLLKQIEKLNFCICTSDGLESPKDGWIGERKILLGHECISITATEYGIMVGAKFLKDGVMTERNIRCGTLVGSDGAGSTVRNLMGVAMKGEKDLQRLVSVHFMSRDLGNYLLGERPGMLFFIFNTEAIGFLLHMIWTKENLCYRKLVDINVIGINPWVMHAEVAEKFVSSNNQIILAGDAAHHFPPAGGFGMNTGIQDAHNLAWKIAAIVKGISPSSLLQTYETERKPETFSTLDLVSGDKLEFLLIISPRKESYDLARAAFKVSKGFGVSLKVCVMWPHGSLENRLDRKVKMSSTSSWWDTCQMTDNGAILVRRDEHIAWRKTTVILDPIPEMESVFSQVLGIQRTKL
ncbi:hypothetical protein MKX01_022070 [Papaver californicum]|nr:hypothetical protein MKX01_022070 [Papaver californicum]